MDKTVLCQGCGKQVSPPIAVWDGMRLNFKCPECGRNNSRAGRFEDLIQEVH
jgi:endogenous inhibitor of DNA gyrase (YacG/DUF329 family)